MKTMFAALIYGPGRYSFFCNYRMVARQVYDLLKFCKGRNADTQRDRKIEKNI